MPPLHEVGSFRHSSPNAMLLLNVPPVAKTAGFRGTHRVVDCRLCRRLLIIAPGGRSNVSFPCFGAQTLPARSRPLPSADSGSPLPLLRQERGGKLTSFITEIDPADLWEEPSHSHVVHQEKWCDCNRGRRQPVTSKMRNG